MDPSEGLRNRDVEPSGQDDRSENFAAGEILAAQRKTLCSTCDTQTAKVIAS